MKPIKPYNNVTLTDTGLIFDGIDEQTFFSVGHQLVKNHTAAQWAIGDWYNAIRWGDKAAACGRVGLEPETARNYGKVAACFEIGDRSVNCSFGVHERIAVAALPYDTKLALLKKAEEEKWTVRQTRTKVKEAQAHHNGVVFKEESEDEMTDTYFYALTEEIVGVEDFGEYDTLEDALVKVSDLTASSLLALVYVSTDEWRVYAEDRTFTVMCYRRPS